MTRKEELLAHLRNGHACEAGLQWVNTLPHYITLETAFGECPYTGWVLWIIPDWERHIGSDLHFLLLNFIDVMLREETYPKLKEKLEEAKKHLPDSPCSAARMLVECTRMAGILEDTPYSMCFRELIKTCPNVKSAIKKLSDQVHNNNQPTKP